MRSLLVAGLAVLLLTAGSAQAQPAPWEPERLTAGWTFVPALGFGGLWDSNTTLRVKGDPQLDQWVGVVNPRGELNFNGRRSRFAIGYSGSLEAYDRFEELTRYDQRGRLVFRHQATPRLQFRAQSSVSLSPSTDRIELPGLPFENVGTTQAGGRAGFDYAASRRSTVAAEYDFQWVDFDRNSPSLIGRGGVLNGGRAHAGSASYRYAFTSRFSAGGAYSYRRANTDDDVQRIRVQDALGTVTVRLTEHTTLEGGAGMAYLNVLTTGETRQGPSMRARLAHSFEQVQVDVAYDRTYVPSWTFGGTTTNEEARSSVRVPFARGRGFVAGGLSYSHNEPLVRSGDRIVLDAWRANGTLGYAFARWIRVEGYFSGSFQDTSARGEINRTRIGLQFVTFKPVRIE